MSKTTAKIIIAFIWASSVLVINTLQNKNKVKDGLKILFQVALPTGFLFKFSYVYDDVNGGLKPFCSTEENYVVNYPTSTELAPGNLTVNPTGLNFSHLSNGLASGLS